MKPVVFILLFALAKAKTLSIGKVKKVKDDSVAVGHIKKVEEPIFSLRSNFLGQVEYDISAFGKDFRLSFTNNRNLLAKTFRIKFRRQEGMTTMKEEDNNGMSFQDCHLVHTGPGSIAAISDCGKSGKIRGFVSAGNETFEISPLTEDMEEEFLRFPEAVPGDLAEAGTVLVEDLYIVRKVRTPSFAEDTDDFILPTVDNTFGNEVFPIEAQVYHELQDPSIDVPFPKTIEIGVFVDDKAYKNVMEISEDENEVVAAVLAMLNQVSAIYRHPSLGEPVEVSVLSLDILTEMPENLKESTGERVQTLKQFCQYSESINLFNDTSPYHWDLGVLLTGADLWYLRAGDKNYGTLGLAPTGGICSPKASCVVTEFNTKPEGQVPGHESGTPYPTSGFGAAFILAHEMAHSLGVKHDGSGNNCSREGFIMSPTGETAGETRWSECSKQVVQNLRKNCLRDKPTTKTLNVNDMPGHMFDADRQCQLFWTESDSRAVKDAGEDQCSSLKCFSTNFDRDVNIGQALEGTPCHLPSDQSSIGNGICIDGQCTMPSTRSTLVFGDCRSGCLHKSTGFRTVLDLATSEETLELCPDDSFCSSDRSQRSDYATKMCQLVHDDDEVEGMPAIYTKDRPDLACVVFCSLGKETLPRWQPLTDPLTKANILFPNGTWCHRFNDNDYFCLDGNCIQALT